MLELQIPIDWSELDVFGHVNNVAFFKYAQAGRVNLCEVVGLTTTNEEGKLSFIVAKCECEFQKPLFYPGKVLIKTVVVKIGTTSFHLRHELIDLHGDIAATLQDVLVLFDYSTREKVNLSEEFKARLLHVGS